jgi:branched-chain amino acid aminotransferase
MANSTHAYAPDNRNESILINISGALVTREQATVSVFDSGFILGDGVWEGLRVHNGAIPFLGRHLKRLWEGAKALDLDMGLSQQALTDRLFRTLEANQMTDHVHIRLMVTRGIKSTPYQDPVVTISGPTIVIIPECEVLDPSLNDRGLRLYTVYTRRGYADVQDPKINSHSKLN